ncbi:Putative flippase GtrA (transmembrane translocase of bactoprenol-linked glucose) [Pollutimonas bauzanensis]|uniref:Putative flippase GtrA (Transmembrane translocase of bactoprenol-linked glucose) n=2 Tax=Pollutimonas bauzanensis TaxID=658167 RepID=A0A1M5ZUJ5_9BURK|nr:Putative flippase GtrA (transmembrane translocase of bactoprenol-linked glucose) [Pollutimonas bauzanensis]
MTAAIYFFVMWIANSGLGINYILAVTFAYIISTTFHFMANRHFTFAAATGHQGYQLVRYLVLWLINYVITIGVVTLCVEKFLWSPYLGVCISVVFTMCTGYALARYWVFKVN